MIQISNLTKEFGHIKALNNINLTLSDQKNHVVIGSSGSGKTTLLRILLGLETPTEGSVTVHGQPVSTMDKIGYMPQNGGLFPHMTARRNVSLMASLRGWSKSEIQKRIETLSELIGLDVEFLDRYPSQMSGGQRQRISLMRAIFLDPEIIILDEPLGALDPLIRFELQSELANIFEKLNKTVIIVTHDLAEAIFFGDSITLLHEGDLIQSGTFKDLNTAPANPFVTRFLQAQRTSTYEGNP